MPTFLRALWWAALVAGFILGMCSPLLILRDGRWLLLIIPAMLAYTLWLMREYQKWGRSRRPFQ